MELTLILNEMADDTIFLNLAFGRQYMKQQDRCNASIRAIYPDANIKSWTNDLPPGARAHSESLYGFKVHAVQWALDAGYKRIVWLDTACVLNRTIERWWELTPKYGVLAAKDDNLLVNHISDKYVKESDGGLIYGTWHLVGGSLYIFDFDIWRTKFIFDGWRLDESLGLFGSQYEQSSGLINKHRHDESSMAVNLYSFGHGPVTCEELGYNVGEAGIISKFHFK